MEALLPTILGALPDLTFGGALLILLVLSYRRSAEDRTAMVAEIQRLTSAHDAELAELRADIAAHREREDQLQARLDAEMEARRQAQGWTPPTPGWMSGQTRPLPPAPPP